jgi:hypothetical protein
MPTLRVWISEKMIQQRIIGMNAAQKYFRGHGRLGFSLNRNSVPTL